MSRPKPLLELGDGYLEPGPLREPVRLPTGAIWSPRLTVWGTFHSGLAGGSSGNGDVAEWANRLDLFAEARFSPTERLVLGMRPLDEDGEFSGYDIDEGDWNGVSNFRATALVAWNDIERIGGMNSSFRANASVALDDDATVVASGLVLTSVLSWVPHHTHDNVYFGSFLGFDDFTSAARATDAGGPLGNIGMLFAATGSGSLGAPLNAQGGSVVGAAVGYQQLFGLGRTQMIYEIGSRIATNARHEDSDSIAAGTRYRRAFGQRTFVTLDAFMGHERDRDRFVGGRAELAWRF